MKAQPFTSGILCLLIPLFFSACSQILKVERLEYDFDAGYSRRTLVMDVPAGFVEESHDKDNSGFLVRTFRYKDGAEFFIACRDMASNPVISLDASAQNSAKLPLIWGEAGSGDDANGSRWCRQFRDGFMIGYDYVPQENRELYDKAVHSVRIIH